MGSKKIGLFFGSFNPVHVGHMIIANHLSQHSDLDAIWMVLSPQNPFKEKASLANNFDRLHLLNLAIGMQAKIKASDIEFGLPIPSYTIDTLQYLEEKYPDHEFNLIMGSDNVPGLPKWKNAELLLRKYHIYVYMRPGYPIMDLSMGEKLKIVEDVPLMHISASFIRNEIKSGRSVQYLVPDTVFDYLQSSALYR